MRVILNKFLQYFVICLTLFSCQKKPSGEYGLDPSDTLRIAFGAEPPTLDWNKSSDTTSSSVIDNLMDGLVVFEYLDNKINLGAGLATNWEGSQKNTVWKFQIRKNVQWEDGQPFEPSQVIDGWQRLLDPKTASPYAYFLFGIQGAEDYNSGKIKDFSKVGVKLKGHELQVKLNNSMYFPYALTHTSTYPVRKDLIAKYGEDKWMQAGNFVGLGAYSLKRWDHDKVIILKANPKYYGTAPKTPNILGYIITDVNTQLNMFNAGQIDVLDSVPSVQLRELKKRSDFVEYGILSSYYFGFNTQIEPTNNPLVRRAIAHAIDRTKVTRMMAGGQKPMSGWIPEGILAHDPEAGLKFDPVKAKDLLKQAGYDESNPLPPIQLSFNTNQDHKRIIENVQSQIKKNLGVEIQVQNNEWKVYLGNLKAKPTQIYRMGWVADYPDPHNFYELMTSKSENNYTGWKSPKFDKAVVQAVSAPTDEQRLKYYKEASKLLLEEGVSVIPMFSGVAHKLIHPSVISYPMNPMSQRRLKNVSLQR